VIDLKFIWYQVRRNPVSLAGIVIVAIFALVAILAPVIAPPPAGHGDAYLIPREGYSPVPNPPSWEHKFGTTQGQYDIFYGVIWGTRSAFKVGLAVIGSVLLLGIILGSIAGYFGGIIDQVMMRTTDTFLVIPELPLLLVLVAVMGPSLWIIILLISLLGWMGFARVVRSQVLSLKERPFVDASRILGGSELYIIFSVLTPNVMNLVYVTLAMSAPAAIYSEAYLSFLGLYPFEVMTWGRMLHDALLSPGGVQKWWWILPPGLCIAAISISFIFIGYALDEVFNPKLRER